ncbi:MAG TPA: hypothetical protein VIJ70_02465 [Gaiellaceae bacterium]
MSKADTQALGIANAHLAFALPHLAGKLGQELVGIGPGMYQLGKGEVQDVAAATKGNLGFKNTKAAANAIGQSFKETVTHPVRQFETDPLGLITNALLGAGAVGRVASVGDALRAGEIGQAAKAVVKRPLPPERTLKVGGGETFSRPASLNLGVAHLQTKVVDPLFQHAIDHPQGAAAKILNHRLLGPEVRVGRDMRLQGQYDQARLAGGSRELAQYGTATPTRLMKSADSKVARLMQKLPGAKRLTAGEQKAVQIIGSGKAAATHFDLHSNAISHGVGDLSGHQTQLALVEAAAKHMESPRVVRAAKAAETAIHQRELLKGLTEDQILHRLGAHATTIEHGANGFVGESPIQELTRLEGEAKAFPKPREGERAQVEGRLAANQGEQAIPAYTADQVQAMHHELAGNLAQQQAPYSATHLRSLKLRESELRNEIQQAHNPDPNRVRQLRIEEAGLHNRLEQLDHYGQIKALNGHLVAEGVKARENGAFYLPMDTGVRANTRLGRTAPPVSPGRYGVAPPKVEGAHHYEGKAIVGGKFRTDATNQAARASQQAIKDWAAIRQYSSLWKQSVEDPAAFGGLKRGGGHGAKAVAIRDIHAISDDHKSLFNQVSRGDLNLNEFSDQMKPLIEQLVNQHIEPGEHVRYVHANRLGPLKPYSSSGPLADVANFFDRTNNVFRIGRYGPAYLKWLPQNLAVNLGEQGPHIIRNAREVFTTIHRLNSDDYNTLAALAGTGPAHALIGDSGRLVGAQTKAAAFWSKVDDHMSRMLQLTHELRREGIKSPAQVAAFAKKLRDPDLKAADPATYRLGLRIWKRANDKAINYTITNVERATLKKLLVAWPWTKGASMWAARFFGEHPVEGKVLAQAGKQGEQSNQRFYERLGGYEPSYLEATVPAGLAHGVDTSFLNIMETPGSFLEGLSGISPGTSQYRNELFNNVMPVESAAIDALHGTTKYGGTDKTGTDPYLQLAKTFAPVGDTILGLQGSDPKAVAKKTFTPGPVPALERAFGSPYSSINQQSAANAGYRSMTNTLSAADKQKLLAEITQQVLAALAGKR